MKTALINFIDSCLNQNSIYTYLYNLYGEQVKNHETLVFTPEYISNSTTDDELNDDELDVNIDEFLMWCTSDMEIYPDTIRPVYSYDDGMKYISKYIIEF